MDESEINLSTITVQSNKQAVGTIWFKKIAISMELFSKNMDYLCFLPEKNKLPLDNS